MNKKTVDGEASPFGDNLPIPTNRIAPEMPSAVREFAEILADIAVWQLRSQPIDSKGEQPNE